MKILDMIIIILALFAGGYFGVFCLFSRIQSFIHDRKLEKRKIKKDKSDLEYRCLRRKEFR